MATIWFMPFALLAIGLAIFGAAWLVSRRFDRMYPHLSRKGLLEAEQRERVGRRPPIPVPPFHPKDWSRSARDDFESDRLDRSLERWGEQVARHSKPEKEGEERTAVRG